MMLSFSQYPELQNVGGSTKVSANGYSDPNCGSSSVFVIQTSAGKYVAFSSACPHACCDVNFTGSGFHCPCHQAQFDMNGVSAGIRTNQPLPSLMVCADANGVTISW
jgi:Rieske Fe-S protein